MDQVKIGKLIASLRREKKMTQKVLAEKLGVTDRAISKWENGRGLPEVAAFQPLAEALGISVEELLSGECNETEADVVASETDLSEEISEAAEKISTPRDLKKLKKLILKGVIITGGAVLIALSVILISFLCRSVVVPELEGKSLVEATGLVDEAGLKLETEFQHSDTIGKTIVMSQSIEAGDKARHGSKIILVVSKGKEQIALPDLRGKTLAEAEAELKKLGFKVTVAEAFSSTVSTGKVSGQSVQKNSKAEKGSKIIITVSKGPDYVTVPNIKGMTEEKAKETLKEAGLELVSEIAFSSSVAEGRVISQSTPGGEQAIRDSAIYVKVSAGVANTKGTTPSNANHFGKVTTQGNWIYFASNDHAIYRMHNDGSRLERIYDDSAVSLNVVEEWIYYVDGTIGGIHKVKLDGTGYQKLSNTTSYKMYVEGDWIYYTGSWNGGRLYKMKTDGSEVTQVIQDSCTEYIVSGNYIYYIKDSDNLVYKCRADGSGKTLVCTGFGGMELCLTGGRLAVTSGYKILTVKLDGSGFTSFGTSNIQCAYLNGHDGWIYYLEHDFTAGGDESYFCKVKPDGSGKTKLYQYEFLNHANTFINVVDGWIYFQNEHQNDDTYRVRTNGTDLQRVG